MAAALRLLDERSFSALSLREVTREAGIVPAAFYRHFESMEALGLVLIDESFRALRDMLRGARAGKLDPKRVIESSVDILVEAMALPARVPLRLVAYCMPGPGGPGGYQDPAAGYAAYSGAPGYPPAAGGMGAGGVGAPPRPAPGGFPPPGPPMGGAAAPSFWVEINGVRHPLNRPVTSMGRGTDVDLRVDDPSVSRRHAEIRTGTPSVISDLGSTNGIVVDDQHVRQAQLRDGSVIHLGNTTIVFRQV